MCTHCKLSLIGIESTNSVKYISAVHTGFMFGGGGILVVALTCTIPITLLLTSEMVSIVGERESVHAKLEARMALWYVQCGLHILFTSLGGLTMLNNSKIRGHMKCWISNSSSIPHIIESVDSICRDGADTPISPIQK